jgi:hypothetical protein
MVVGNRELGRVFRVLTDERVLEELLAFVGFLGCMPKIYIEIVAFLF